MNFYSFILIKRLIHKLITESFYIELLIFSTKRSNPNCKTKRNHYATQLLQDVLGPKPKPLCLTRIPRQVHVSPDPVRMVPVLSDFF